MDFRSFNNFSPFSTRECPINYFQFYILMCHQNMKSWFFSPEKETNGKAKVMGGMKVMDDDVDIVIKVI